MPLTLQDQLAEVVALMRGSNLELDECVRQFRKQWITFALVRNRGNSCRAARELQIHRNTLSRSIAELGIDVQAIREQSRRPKPIRKPQATVSLYPQAGVQP